MVVSIASSPRLVLVTTQVVSLVTWALAISTSNEECHLSRSTTCFGANVYMCNDYVHLDNLSDINAYRTVMQPQRTAMYNANPVNSLKSCILSALRKSLSSMTMW